MNDTWRIKVVAEHNNARSTLASPAATNMVTLVYDLDIETVAQNYLNTNYPTGCPVFQHNAGRGNLGENWYSGAPAQAGGDPGATAAWTTWALLTNPFAGKKCSEKDNFYSANGCVQVPCYNADGSFNSSWNTGHFTQVMWATTARIGCGYNACGTICNYSPPGNWNMPRGLLKPSDVWGVASGTSSPQASSSASSSSKSSSSLFSSSSSSSKSSSSSSSGSTGTAPGMVCYQANDAVFAGSTPSSGFKSRTNCPSTLTANCRVCGPASFSALQTGSAPLTVDVNITCTSAASYISYAMPTLITTTGWSGSAWVPTLATLQSTVRFQLTGKANANAAQVRGEWCINNRYYASFPVTFTHKN
jgi:hypothetical protein